LRDSNKIIKLPALPLQMNGRRFGLRHQPPLPGEHSIETLDGLGYSREQIEEMVAEKVVSCSPAEKNDQDS